MERRRLIEGFQVAEKPRISFIIKSGRSVNMILDNLVRKTFELLRQVAFPVGLLLKIGNDHKALTSGLAIPKNVTPRRFSSVNTSYP
jgi:hypothetical protein